jgi:acetyl-CoA acetyltransferase
VTSAARTAAVVGVGYTPFTKASGQSVLDLAHAAAADALTDAGLTGQDVDGVGSFMVMHDSVKCQAVATTLAVHGLRWSVDLDLGGQAPCHLVGLASSAIATGQADVIVLYRALNGRSGARVGTMTFDGPAAPWRYPIGYDAYLMYCAMWAQRFLAETDQGADDLGAVAVAQRGYAVENERAVRRRPLTAEDHASAPIVVSPYRADDCTVEVDGACALVITSVDAARDLAQPPVVIEGAAYAAGAGAGLDMGDHLLWEDYTRNYTGLLRDELFGRAGVTPSDVDVAEIYDCFSSTVLMGLEGLGFCERGGSGAFVRSGATRLDGAMPVNTHGGLLSEGYLHGMNTVCEAVLQVQGRGGVRQAPRHEVCAVTSGALMDGSALVLTADR